MKIIQTPSPNYDQRPDGIQPDMLIMHYTDMLSAEASLERLRNPETSVSSHYLIDEDGTVYQLVPDHLRAYHAGVSSWKGRQGLNAYSIGIEIQNPGHTNGYRDFPSCQIEALKILSQDLMTRHRISAKQVLGHSDVAPFRKLDPGEKFPWRELAKSNVGLWPTMLDRPLDPIQAMGLLEKIGYQAPSNDQELGQVLFAFQQHFMPHHLSRELDSETCSRIYDVAQVF